MKTDYSDNLLNSCSFLNFRQRGYRSKISTCLQPLLLSSTFLLALINPHSTAAQQPPKTKPAASASLDKKTSEKQINPTTSQKKTVKKSPQKTTAVSDKKKTEENPALVCDFTTEAGLNAFIDKHFNLAKNMAHSTNYKKYQDLLREKIHQLAKTTCGQELLARIPPDTVVDINLGSTATKGNAGLCSKRGDKVSIALRDTGVQVATLGHELTHFIRFLHNSPYATDETLTYAVGNEISRQLKMGAPTQKKYHYLSESLMQGVTRYPVFYTVISNFSLFDTVEKEELANTEKTKILPLIENSAARTENAPKAHQVASQQTPAPVYNTKRWGRRFYRFY